MFNAAQVVYSSFLELFWLKTSACRSEKLHNESSQSEPEQYICGRWKLNWNSLKLHKIEVAANSNVKLSGPFFFLFSHWVSLYMIINILIWAASNHFQFQNLQSFIWLCTFSSFILHSIYSGELGRCLSVWHETWCSHLSSPVPMATVWPVMLAYFLPSLELVILRILVKVSFNTEMDTTVLLYTEIYLPSLYTSIMLFLQYPVSLR